MMSHQKGGTNTLPHLKAELSQHGTSVPSRLRCRNTSATCTLMGALSLGLDTASAAALAYSTGAAPTPVE